MGPFFDEVGVLLLGDLIVTVPRIPPRSNYKDFLPKSFLPSEPPGWKRA